MCLGVVLLEPDGLAVGGDGTVHVAFGAQSVAEVVVGQGELGVEFDDLAETGDGAVEVMLVARPRE